MIVTILLGIMMMSGLFLMLLAGVGFIQDKKFFSSAPREVQDVILPREERFPGAHAIGWMLLVISALMMAGAVIIGAVNGVMSGFGFRQFITRFLTMLFMVKAFDIIFFDWILLCNAGFHFFPYFYPETKEVLNRKMFGYNWKTHLIQIVGFSVFCVLLAWLCTLF